MKGKIKRENNLSRASLLRARAHHIGIGKEKKLNPLHNNYNNNNSCHL